MYCVALASLFCQRHGGRRRIIQFSVRVMYSASTKTAEHCFTVLSAVHLKASHIMQSNYLSSSNICLILSNLLSSALRLSSPTMIHPPCLYQGNIHVSASKTRFASDAKRHPIPMPMNQTPPGGKKINKAMTRLTIGRITVQPHNVTLKTAQPNRAFLLKVCKRQKKKKKRQRYIHHSQTWYNSVRSARV